tara:strand:- start:1479 stop:1646 length:168 start_codon:yes stop_codon:yes gene_type:complete
MTLFDKNFGLDGQQYHAIVIQMANALLLNLSLLFSMSTLDNTKVVIISNPITWHH